MLIDHNKIIEDQRPTNVTASKNKVRQAELAGLHMATETFECQRHRQHRPRQQGVGLLGRLPRVRNSWQKNVGGTSKPVGLCSPPPPDQPGHDGHHHHHHQEKHKKKDPCTCQRNPKAI